MVAFGYINIRLLTLSTWQVGREYLRCWNQATLPIASFRIFSKTFTMSIASSSAFLLGGDFCRTLANGKDGHSKEAMVDFANLKVCIIPALADNFMYLLIDKSSRKAIAVDPVEPQLILDVVQREEAVLTAALTTHHHSDHAGGNSKLLQLCSLNNPKKPRIDIYGGDDRIEGLNKKVGHGDLISIGALNISCLFTPCHTSGHICYYVNTTDSEMQKPLVFTGDTLFVGGCGRFFEGTAAQMHKALLEILGTLPYDTLVFCGHEYTVANLRFVLSVDKSNYQAKLKLDSTQKLREVKHVTVPSSIGEELRYNIFMRCNIPTIQTAVNATDAVDCMDKLRTMKNNF